MKENYVSSPSRTTGILKHYNITLKKIYGQNFLIDTNVLKKIANFSDLKKDDIVLEVGSGIGSLTEILLPKIKNMVCVELDKNLAKAFNDIFILHIDKKIILIREDAMKVDYDGLYREYGINKFVSNLPYNIAAPLILRILNQTDKIKDFYITIQKDIADRILAKPGDKNYNAFTVKLNYYTEFIGSFPISKNCFYPKPFVDSVTVYLKRKDNYFPEKVFKKINDTLSDDILRNNSMITNFTCNFFEFVEDCFSHRRKKLINSLILSKDYYKDIQGKIFSNLEALGFKKDVRPEQLSYEDYITLFTASSPRHYSI
ncbi:MAG: 16S rRNA (adenine(1518)-N(6)/adenine(1519)-N(6))-dimethyltransferase RsmA [Actinomycetota bacterium]|nr:16S rRNA (adenine(1518)-N(6)/adenine(1519)-N(6))-dimethyltransferase RsmA [Actinomycetota bacterium]